VRKEDVPVLTLLPEELNFLIYDQAFAETLTHKLKEAKNIFVFGCTVALRFSDLMRLNKSNLRTVNNDWYLVVRSKKTSTDTQIRLPDYAIEVLKSFKLKGNRLLPKYYLSTLNDHIKMLCEKAGFIQPVSKSRSVRGKLIEIKNYNDNGKTEKQYRFCDLVSSHTMRRTAITTMLCLGMPEQVVRKISGHSPMSKEFFRYISLAQSYQDNESVKMFEILKQKRLVV
jgi:integrase